MLHRFLAPDNFVQDLFNTQNFNRYGYALNNPLMYTDPNGEFFFVPILVGMAYGALAGAAVSAVVYTVSAAITGSWTWGGLGTSMLYGAIGGAISGGLGSVATSIGNGASSFFQSATYNMMSEIASQVGTSAMMGDNITLGTIAGGIAGGFAGAKFGNWSGVKGGWFKNAVGEIGFNTVKGGVRGAVAGGVGAVVDGNNIGNAILYGARNGAIGGASQTVAMIATFGATYKPSDAQLSHVKAMSKKYGVDYNGVAFRKGGLYQALQPLWTPGKQKREVTWGRNIVTFGKKTSSNVMGHEFGHIMQGNRQGWATFQGMGIYEQIWLTLIGKNPYYIPGTNEYEAERYLNSVGGSTY